MREREGEVRFVCVNGSVSFPRVVVLVLLNVGPVWHCVPNGVLLKFEFFFLHFKCICFGAFR